MVKTDPSLELLAGVPLFADLSKAELRKVAGLLKPIVFTEGQDLVVEGTAAGRFYLITEGSAKVTVGGREHNQIGPGDCVGEIALIDRQPRSATVTATTPVQTVGVASFNFRALLREHPVITEKLLVTLCRWIRAEHDFIEGSVHG